MSTKIFITPNFTKKISYISILILIVTNQASSEENSMNQSRTEVLEETIVSAESIDTLPKTNAGGQTGRGGRLGLLGNADLMKTPFSTMSYTSQMILDQQAKTAADILAQDASVRSTGQTGGIFDSFFIRGFPIGEGNAGEVAFDGVYGVAPNYRIMTTYAERIEVIKGPAALLYGMSPNSSVGGVINIIPKRAGYKDLTKITTDYMSNAQFGGNVDISRRFGEAREFGIRLNGSHHDGNTPLDNQSAKSMAGSISLDYQGRKLRATLDMLGQTEKVDSPSRPFFLPANGLVPSAPKGRNNITQSWEWAKVEDRSGLFKGEYDITDKITFFASAGKASTGVSRLFGNPTILNLAGDTSSRPDYFVFDINRSTYEGGIRSAFDTGFLSHKVAFQVSSYEDQIDRGNKAGTTVLSNIYNPQNSAKINVLKPNDSKLSKTKLDGVALADTLSVLKGRLQVTAGIRKQNVESSNYNQVTGAVATTYDDSAITPLVGLVVQPWNNVSVYANYIEGLSKGDTAPLTAVNA